MLRFNGTYVDRVKYLGGPLHATSLVRVAGRQKLIEHRQKFGPYTSMPQGYQSAYRAVLPTFATSGFIAARLSGSSDLTNTAVRGLGNMDTVLQGEGTITANGNMAANVTATLQGSGSITANLKALGNMGATLDAGARPSAFDIAQEIWQSQAANYNAAGTMGEKLNGAGSAGDPMTGLVEGTLTLRDALRALLAVNTGDATGLEGSTMEFMSNDGTKVRVRATYSNGVRTLTLLDVS